MSNKCGFYSFINEADDNRKWVRCFNHNVLIERDICKFGSYCVPGGDSDVIHRLASECEDIRRNFAETPEQKCDFRLSIDVEVTNHAPYMWHKAYCETHKQTFDIIIAIVDGKFETGNQQELEYCCKMERNK
jgi:hypothetical protein